MIWEGASRKDFKSIVFSIKSNSPSSVHFLVEALQLSASFFYFYKFSNRFVVEMSDFIAVIH
jgi:hypothetical protein